MPIVIIGSLDTKGTEVAWVRDRIAARGHQTLVIDTGVLGEPALADVTRAEVARSGGADLAALVAGNDRGVAVSAMAAGATAVLTRLHGEGLVDGVIAVGGGAGTAVGTAAMRALPVGIPKVMVSTLAGGDVRAFVGVTDIVMVPSIVDIAGLNRLSRGILARAAAAVCAMASSDVPPDEDRPMIAASMFGNTTTCVEAARGMLERAGYEVLVFHATGVGGRTMEGLIESGQIAGVLDVTTTEWADELLGGVMAAGPGRRSPRASRRCRARTAAGRQPCFAPPQRWTMPARVARCSTRSSRRRFCRVTQGWIIWCSLSAPTSGWMVTTFSSTWWMPERCAKPRRTRNCTVT